ncbi:MAG: DUF748 domain-containing protein [Thermodesulfobacteriota bacterium]
MTTSQETTENEKKMTVSWLKRGMKIALSLVLLTGLGLLAIQFGIKVYLEKWLLNNGADSAVVSRVRLNPFTGVVALNGVDVEQGGGAVFTDSTIYFNVGMKNLLSRGILVQQAVLSDITIDIETMEDGTTRIASYSMAPAKEEGEESAETPVEEAAPPVEEGLSWIFRAENIRIENVAVKLRQPDLSADLLIEEALIKNLNTDPNDRDGSLSLKATLNGAAINLDLDTFVISPELDLQGKVSIDTFQLNDLAGYLGEWLGPFSGAATLDGHVDFTMDSDINLKVAYDGIIHLENGDIGGEGWGTKATVHNEGKISFSMTEEEMVVDVNSDLKLFEAGFDMPDPLIDIDNPEIGIKGRTIVTIAEEVVVDTGADLNLGPTVFAMDNLKTTADKLSWQGKIGVGTGTESKELAVRVDGKLGVTTPAYSMDIDDTLMEIDNQMLYWNGKVEYILGIGADDPSFVRTDGILTGGTTTLKLPEVIDIGFGKLDLLGKVEVTLGHDIGVNYTGDVALNEIAVAMDGLAIGDDYLGLTGSVKYVLGESDQSVSLDGTVESKGIVTDVADMRIDLATFATRGDWTLVMADSFALQGSLGLKGGPLTMDMASAPLLSVKQLKLDGGGERESGGIQVESFGLEQLELFSSDNIPVGVTVASVAAEKIESPDFVSGSLHRLTVTRPVVKDKEGKTQWASLASITADSIKLADDLTVSLGALRAGGGEFMQGEEDGPLATLQGLLVKQASYSIEQGFVCDSVNLDGLYADLVKKKSPDKKDEEKKDDKAEKKATPLPVKIAQVTVSGKSGFKFTDESIAKTFMTLFAIEKLQVDDIDLNKTEQPFTFVLNGNFDKYSPLTVTGKSAPLGTDVMAELQASLQNLSMLHISPYAIEAIGTFFPNGTLDYKADLKMGDGKLDMTNNLILRELESETLNGELADKLNNQLPISLDLVLGILSQRDGTIDLNVPLSGELSDISIGLSDIIITAVGKAVTVTVTPYLAYSALGPAGVLAFVGAKVGQKLIDTELPVIEFEPGVRQLNDEQKKTLTEIGQVIEKAEEKKYRICAKVSPRELKQLSDDKEANQAAFKNEAIRKELFRLGEHRARRVQSYLMENHHIIEERLAICNPGLQFDKDKKPSIKFLEVPME